MTPNEARKHLGLSEISDNISDKLKPSDKQVAAISGSSPQDTGGGGNTGSVGKTGAAGKA